MFVKPCLQIGLNSYILQVARQYMLPSVQQSLRLSETVLSEGIKLFSQKENLIPTGVSLEAAEALTDKTPARQQVSTRVERNTTCQ